MCFFFCSEGNSSSCLGASSNGVRKRRSQLFSPSLGKVIYTMALNTFSYASVYASEYLHLPYSDRSRMLISTAQPGTSLPDGRRAERSPRFYARGRQGLSLSNTPFSGGSTADSRVPVIALVAVEKEGRLSRASSSGLTAGGGKGQFRAYQGNPPGSCLRC